MTHELIPPPVRNLDPWPGIGPWRPSPNGHGYYRLYRHREAPWVQHVDTRTQYVVCTPLG
ncbi:hypothetical protein [Mycolicibacterium mucogenicum]|uniref:Uncharacterized protein n=1 Tax=Mycolicibacterium mucogenicum TaxID=56689 RepID=A0A4R5WAK9_MYCMU|nr:hypothetical protein [Mycolicibacterium mucogenicum]TDK86281.1 hypothetical protein EUA03_20005 [Mycolicibacterium mucogenicum]